MEPLVPDIFLRSHLCKKYPDGESEVSVTSGDNTIAQQSYFLFLAKAIIEAHNGTISVNRVLGERSIFTMFFPNITKI